MGQAQTPTFIRPFAEADRAGVDELIAGLDAWFNLHARTISIPLDLRHQRAFVAVRQEQIVGFITLFVAEGKLNIGWLGVRRELHRQGIGRLLLAKASEVAKEYGIRELATYTLGDGVEDAEYALTRQFYFDNGFYIYQRNQTDNPGCPEEIKLAKIVE